MGGFNNVYRVLAAPNGHEFTICQVIMSTKCSYDLITPLFLGVDVSSEGDVVIICSIDLKIEAESLLSHFGLYVAVIFGSVVWEAFTMEYKLKMDCYQYCPRKNCAVEIDNSTIDSDESVDREFAKCGFTDDVLVIPVEVEFDLPHQFTFTSALTSTVSSEMKMETPALSNRTCLMPPLPPPKRRPPTPSSTSFHAHHP